MRKYWSIARALVFPRSTYPTGLSARQWKRWSSTAPTSADLTPAAFALRDYQEECIQAVLDHHEQGNRRLGISLATGSGKTVIFTQLIDRIQPLHPAATQTLILVHRRELVEQAANHCRNRYPDKIVEIEMGTKHASGNADITIASVQSVVSGNRINKFNPKTFKLILIDEAHHAVAKSYRKTLDHFGAMKKESDVYVVGVSATFSRTDGVELGAVVDHIVYHRDFVAMIESGWLSKVLFTTVKTNLKLDKVKLIGGNGDFNVGELAQVVNTAENNDVIVRSWIEKAGNRKSTLVFCVDIEHVVDMSNVFRRYGYESYYVTGTTPPKERRKLLDDFKEGKYPILVNCGVFTEGTDIPNIDCVLLARPTRSKNLLVQMIGRGMRLHHSKEDCHVVDVVGAVERGVVTTPTLFGLPPDEVLDKTPSQQVQDKFELLQNIEAEEKSNSIEEAENEEGEKVKKEIDPEIYAKSWSVTFVDYESIHDLLSDKKAEWSVRRFSKNAWVWVAPGRYILSCHDGSYIAVYAKPDGGFYATETRALPQQVRNKFKSPYMRPREIIRHADTLEAVINGADTFANAADLLTKMMHGATKVFQELKSRKKREEKKELKALKMSMPMDETVKVGSVTSTA
ncbi:hypothetical protein ABW19_dt0210197 [Dactylella cylindrospora]|nr:hypothetical protein ABW19_dt0210197 [Dactylella cylindrospora]